LTVAVSGTLIGEIKWIKFGDPDSKYDTNGKKRDANPTSRIQLDDAATVSTKGNQLDDAATVSTKGN